MAGPIPAGPGGNQIPMHIFKFSGRKRRLATIVRLKQAF